MLLENKQTEKKKPYEAFEFLEYRYFLILRACFVLAIQMQAVIVGWQMYELSGKNTLMLGMIGLAEAIPSIGVALYAGYLADMHSRKRIIQIAILVLFLATFTLTLLSFEGATFSTNTKIYAIFVIIFITGLARGFVSPANFGLMSQVVSEKALPNAISWNSTVWEGSTVLGPIVAGLVYGYLGVEIAYIIQTILLFGAVVAITLIKNRPASAQRNNNESLFVKLSAGLKFVFSTPILLGAISLDLFAVLFGGAVALLPAFASDVLKVGAVGLGFLRASSGVGAVVTAIILAYYPIKHNAGHILLACVAGFGFCIIGFGLSTNFYLSMFFLFMSGILDSVSVIIRSNIAQIYTPADMKGRVSAVNSMFIASSNEIGAFESGLVAHYFMLVPSVIFGGSMTLLVVLIAFIFAKDLRKLKFD
jgi:MFS family permease